MKTCPVCALALEDTYLFCPDDGSTLGSLPDQSTESDVTSTMGPEDQTAGAVVLYCPACAAEYPLTFKVCPVHVVQLTRHRIPRLSRAGSGFSAGSVDAQATVAEPQSEITKTPTRRDLERSQLEGTTDVGAIEVPDNDNQPVQHAGVAAVDSPPFAQDAAFVGGVTPFDYHESLTDTRERGMERPGFRVAAIATVIALVVFGLMAIYTIVSNLSRRSASNTVKIAANAQAAPQTLPFVRTPQEAQDYKEEAATPTTPAPAEPQSVRPVDRARNESVSPSQPKEVALKNVIARPAAGPAVSSPAATVAATRVSAAPMPPLPRGPSGGFDARLIRVRSTKTAAGFRYDLTFNMQEQAGRSAQWQRVLISTRSANGTSHSEAIPFSHRLGASGALTFTLSVEMTGRSEADWQGRIVCTTLGWDNKGAPLQSSFGASVAP